MKILVVRVTQSLLVLAVLVMYGIRSPQIILSWNSEVSLSEPDIAPKSVSLYPLEVLANLINNNPLSLPVLSPTLMLLNSHPELLYH